MRYIGPKPRVQYIVRGPDGIEDVFARLRHGVLATDTETSGLDWWVDRVGALCFAAGDTAAFFVRDALGTAARWLSDQVKQRRTLVFHHAKFDMHMMRSTFGLHIPYPVHDTMTMGHLLDNRGAPINRYPWFAGNHLKDLAAAFVDPDAHHAEDELTKAIAEATGFKPNKKDLKAYWPLAPVRKAGKYGGLDPWYTLMLYDQFIDRIRYWPQPEGYPPLMELYENEMWLTLALRDMEERGVMADQDYLAQWTRGLNKQLRKARKRLERRAGYPDLNWDSPIQVAKLFFDDLNLVSGTGERSTDKRSLLRLNHPIAAEMLQYRKASTQIKTFAKVLKAAIRPDGAIHTQFRQNVNTGRMSASEPNLHAQDRDSGVRGVFIPRKGLVLRSADYSQIEMRFAAHFSGEDWLINGFNSNPNFDTHAALAQRMFGLKNKAPSPQQRDRGKTMNFAMLYGAGEDAVSEQLIDKVTYDEARRSCIELGYRPKRNESPHHALAQLLRDAVRASSPKIWRFTRDEEKLAERRGFVIDAFGYHRYLERDETYKAMNSKVQGSAVHQNKKGLVSVYRELQLHGALAMLLQVHDDIVYESDGDPKVDRTVLDLLEEHKRFKVPMIADLKGSAKNWQVKEKIKL